MGVESGAVRTLFVSLLLMGLEQSVGVPGIMDCSVDNKVENRPSPVEPPLLQSTSRPGAS